jgi:hypothetical protein
MTDAERMAMLALMTRIEAKVDHVLEQLDGLLAVCERLESHMSAAQRFEALAPGEATLH